MNVARKKEAVSGMTGGRREPNDESTNDTLVLKIEYKRELNLRLGAPLAPMHHHDRHVCGKVNCAYTLFCGQSFRDTSIHMLSHPHLYLSNT